MSLRLGIDQLAPLPQRRAVWLGERPGIFLDRGLELAGGGVIEIAAVTDRIQDVAMLRADQREQSLLEGAYPFDRNRIEIAVDAGIDDDDLLLHLERRE